VRKEQTVKAIAILGSRNPEGRTATSAQALLEGLAREGWQGEGIFLTEKTIERCRQCDAGGWGICRSEGRCVIEDDFAPLVDQIREADIAVFATPVYFGSLSESMRAFLDRLRRICRHESGQAGIADKPAIGICMAGGGGGGAPECAVDLQRVLRTCGFDVVDMIPVRRQNLDLKVDVLKTTGQWLATYTPTE
jgi:multimeric flavodoxin WrbA